jgi:diguanylate cyclase
VEIGIILFQAVVTNLALVTASLFLASQVIFKNSNLGSAVTGRTSLIAGFLAGVLGIVLIFFTVRLNGQMTDYHSFALILAALFGGLPSALVAGIMLALFRLFLFYPVTTEAILSSATIFISALGVSLLCIELKSYWMKWVYSILLIDLLTGVLYYCTNKDSWVLSFIVYVVMTAVGGAVTSSLVNFLVNAKIRFQKIELEAKSDFLTGLSNHRTFNTMFKYLLKIAEDKEECLSLILIDLDYFKKVNDTYGHQNGDLILKQLSGILQSCSRPFDILSRNGGEEFSFILFATKHKNALILAERIRLAVSTFTFALLDGTQLTATVSIGVASYPESTPETLFEMADSALYRAKSSGRNRVCSWLEEED